MIGAGPAVPEEAQPRTRQIIPRPARYRRGGPPPWASSRVFDQLRLAEVRDALGELSADRGELSRDAGGVVRAPGSLDAAVLVPLFEEAGEVRVVLTRRAADLHRHRSEVAFPGGMIDPGEHARHAALREAHEEIGLDPLAVEVLAELPATRTSSSASRITPYVGALSERPLLAPNAAEVERVLDVTLRHLADGGVYRQELWRLPGGNGEQRMDLFELEEDTIWGATARILFNLLSVISGK